MTQEEKDKLIEKSVENLKQLIYEKTKGRINIGKRINEGKQQE